ncbi:hypothetical protein N9955_00795 [bacterium]|nr:hypothetical protein [bacterium]
MSSYLSAGQKLNIDSALDRLHDTFKKDIYAYVDKKVDNTSDLSFNALYGSSSIQPNNSSSRVRTKYTIEARVEYMEKQPEDQIQGNLPNSLGQVRLKVKPADYETLKIAASVEVDDVQYTLNGDASIEGMFSNNYYTVYLKRES